MQWQNWFCRGGAFWIFLAFFFLGAAPGFWAPAVTNVLSENGLAHLVPWAFIPHAVAALLSPLMFGALADHRVRAELLLGVTCLCSAVFLWLAFRSLIWGWGSISFVVFLLLNALISAPMWSLTATIAMRPMKDPRKGFPIVRLGGTIGWIGAGVLVGSVLKLDGSPYIGDWAGGAKFILAALCLMLPKTYPEGNGSEGTWRERLGLGALVLLKERDLRSYFISTALLSIPLAAFYMYTPRHLMELGDSGPSATMAWAQVIEVVAMLAVSALLGRFRIKTVFLWALTLAVLRYGFFAVASGESGRALMITGLLMHGVIYTFFFIVGQIFMEERVESSMRAQAQALLSVMSGGVGGLGGYIFCYYLHRFTVQEGSWTIFWSVLCGSTVLVLVYFALSYRGRCFRRE